MLPSNKDWTRPSFHREGLLLMRLIWLKCHNCAAAEGANNAVHRHHQLPALTCRGGGGGGGGSCIFSPGEGDDCCCCCAADHDEVEGGEGHALFALGPRYSVRGVVAGRGRHGGVAGADAQRRVEGRVRSIRKLAGRYGDYSADEGSAAEGGVEEGGVV
jgi:hypothetical protein